MSLCCRSSGGVQLGQPSAVRESGGDHWQSRRGEDYGHLSDEPPSAARITTGILTPGLHGGACWPCMLLMVCESLALATRVGSVPRVTPVVALWLWAKFPP